MSTPDEQHERPGLDTITSAEILVQRELTATIYGWAPNRIPIEIVGSIAGEFCAVAMKLPGNNPDGSGQNGKAWHAYREEFARIVVSLLPEQPPGLLLHHTLDENGVTEHGLSVDILTNAMEGRWLGGAEMILQIWTDGKPQLVGRTMWADIADDGRYIVATDNLGVAVSAGKQTMIDTFNRLIAAAVARYESA